MKIKGPKFLDTNLMVGELNSFAVALLCYYAALQ